MTAWRIGRAYCPRCRIVRTVVAHPDAEMTCPRCEGPLSLVHGVDALHEEDPPQ